VSIALATAYQESDIRNLDHGDRDSLGLFQQRPSQGWGSTSQVQDPFYATNAFYDALEKVDGYQDMPITEAAQEVQHSAFGGAYAGHEADARALASALTGYSQARYSCRVNLEGADPERLGANGLTPRADLVRRALVRVFGPLPMGGFAPGGVSSGHTQGSAHYEGRAIDVFVRPVNAANKRTGWAIASYLVAHASRLHVDYARLGAAGLLIAGATGTSAWWFGKPFLTSAHAEPVVPVLGPLALASAALFDVGVYLAVVGTTMLTLVSLARASRNAEER